MASRATLGIAALIGSVAASAAPVGPEFRVNTHTQSEQLGPDVASDAGGNFVGVWQSLQQDDPTDWGVYGQLFNARGARLGTEFRVNTHTAGNQSGPSVARNAAGAFVVVWHSFGQDGSDLGIYGKRYSADGTPQGGEFRINTHTLGAQSSPRVAMDPQGHFLVVWMSANQAFPGSDVDVYAQRFDAAGAKVGGEFRVNTATTGAQSVRGVAMDAQGRAVVVWDSNANGQYDVLAQRYDAAGVAKGANFVVNASTGGTQNFPAVAMDAAGDFVIAWQSDASDGDGHGIVAQLRGPAGAIRKADFRVNTYTTGPQSIPSVAMDAGGRFLVIWHSLNQDGAGGGVFGQRFDANGLPEGGEFRVNPFTSGSQANSRVSVDADGDAVALWHSDAAQDGSAKSIEGQRFNGPEDVDLAVHQSDSADPAAVNGALAYSLVVSNLHPASTLTGVAAIDDRIGTATGLVVTDTLPAGATAASASGKNWTCGAPANGKITCRYRAVLPAARKAAAIAVHLTTPGTHGATLSNTARIAAEQVDPRTANNSDVETTLLQ
jgi:hypothetical protein